MRSSGDEKQEFNTTMLLAMALAALLALCFLGVIYGCMENNQAAGDRPHAALERHLVFIG